MDYELLRADRLAKRFDRSLLAKRTDGVIQIFQKRRKWVLTEFGRLQVLVAHDEAELVLSLTHNWSARGVSVPWGYEPLYRKLSEVIRPADEVFEEMNKHNERVRESKDRDMRNQFEGVAEEARHTFKEAFKDINTSTMDKSKDVRRKIDRSTKWQ